MYLYAHALRRAHFIMVNSSWTKNHVDSILQHKDSLFDLVYLFSPLAFFDMFYPPKPPKVSRIVYPPCDTREMVKFSLGHRERIILSIAQFRCELHRPCKYSRTELDVEPGQKRTTKRK